MGFAMSDLALITFVLFIVLEIANLCLDIPELLRTKSLTPQAHSTQNQLVKSRSHRRHHSAL